MKRRVVYLAAVLALVYSTVTAILPSIPVAAETPPTLTATFVWTTSAASSRMVQFQTGDEVIQFSRPNVVISSNAWGSFNPATTISGTVSGDVNGMISGEGNALSLVRSIRTGYDGFGFSVGKVSFTSVSPSGTFDAVGIWDFDYRVIAPGLAHSEATGYFVSVNETGSFAGQKLIGRASYATFNEDANPDEETTRGSVTFRRYLTSEITSLTPDTTFSAIWNQGTLHSIPTLTGDQIVKITGSPNYSTPTDDNTWFEENPPPISGSITNGPFAGATYTESFNDVFYSRLSAVMGWAAGKETITTGSGSVTAFFVNDITSGNGWTGYFFAISENNTGDYANKEYFATVYAFVNYPYVNGTAEVYELSPATPPPLWRHNVEPGDILVNRTASTRACLGQTWTHAGIYVGNGQVVEARFDVEGGIDYYPIEDWDNYAMKDLLRVNNASAEQKAGAVQFAKEQAERGRRGEVHYRAWVGKCSDPSVTAWYCSELVWASYYRQGIDLDKSSTGDDCISLDWVTPDDIHDDNDVELIENEPHQGYPPCKPSAGAIFKAFSPVDLTVIDPDGLTINKESNEIPDGLYIEGDLAGDGDVNDIVVIENRKIGDYLVYVAPDPNASPTDVYSLEALINNEIVNLAVHVQIADTPPAGYTVTSKNTAVGVNVTVTLPGAMVTFSNVSGAGTTSCATAQGNPGGDIPEGFRVRGSFIDITTTATYMAPITVGLYYDPSEPNPQNLKLFHWEGGHWVDVTTWVDTTNHIVYGEVNSFSWFFIGGQWVWIETEYVPVFPSIYIGIGAALGAGVVAYFVRRRLVHSR